MGGGEDPTRLRARRRAATSATAVRPTPTTTIPLRGRPGCGRRSTQSSTARSRSGPLPTPSAAPSSGRDSAGPMTARHRLVRVPASSANLGPGYDVLAAALTLHLELEVEETGEFSIDAAGLDVPLDRTNLCVRAFESLRPADGIAFRITSEIPLAGGLGSSAAAIVAGLLAADHLYELALEPADVLARASEIEGHPDNVAAAMLGGFVLCSSDAAGIPVATRLDVPQGIEAVVVVPRGERVPTAKAREAIPDEVAHADAVANVAAASELVLGIERSDLGLIARGLADRLHQAQRAHLYPRSMEVVEAASDVGSHRAPRSPARARPCSCGASGRTPARSWTRSASASTMSTSRASPSAPRARTYPGSDGRLIVLALLAELLPLDRVEQLGPVDRVGGLGRLDRVDRVGGLGVLRRLRRLGGIDAFAPRAGLRCSPRRAPSRCSASATPGPRRSAPECWRSLQRPPGSRHGARGASPTRAGRAGAGSRPSPSRRPCASPRRPRRG